MIAYDLYIFYTIEFNDKDVSIPTVLKETRAGIEALYFLDIPSSRSDSVKLDRKLPSQDYQSASMF